MFLVLEASVNGNFSCRFMIYGQMNYCIRKRMSIKLKLESVISVDITNLLNTQGKEIRPVTVAGQSLCAMLHDPSKLNNSFRRSCGRI